MIRKQLQTLCTLLNIDLESGLPEIIAAVECQVVQGAHLTVYVEPQFGDKCFCVDDDGEMTNGQRFDDPDQAGVLVAQWLKAQVEKPHYRR